MNPACSPIARAMAVAVALQLPAVPALAAERAIDKEVTVAATPEAVWQAWTTRDGVVGFFAPDARVEARPGGPFEIWFDPGAAAGHKGADDMRFLALQAPRLLSFTWNAPPSLPEARAQRTVVIVRLEPAAGGHTRVTLHHVGWGDGAGRGTPLKMADVRVRLPSGARQQVYVVRSTTSGCPIPAKRGALREQCQSPRRLLRQSCLPSTELSSQTASSSRCAARGHLHSPTHGPKGPLS